MNLLASALPGFREIRAPLIAGYLYLLCGWLWFGGTIGDLESRGEPWSDLAEVGDAIGPVGWAAVVSVSAYLIGSLIEQIRLSVGSVIRAQPFFNLLLEGVLYLPAAARTRLETLLYRKEAAVNEERNVKGLPPLGIDAPSPPTPLLGARDWDGVRDQMIDKHEAFLAEADRHRAEAEFRAALVLPVLLLAVTLDAQGATTVVLLVGIAIAVGLVTQAVFRRRQWVEVLAVALEQGRATYPEIASWEVALDRYERTEVRRAELQATVEGSPDDAAAWREIIRIDLESVNVSEGKSGWDSDPSRFQGVVDRAANSILLALSSVSDSTRLHPKESSHEGEMRLPASVPRRVIELLQGSQRSELASPFGEFAMAYGEHDPAFAAWGWGMSRQDAAAEQSLRAFVRRIVREEGPGFWLGQRRDFLRSGGWTEALLVLDEETEALNGS